MGGKFFSWSFPGFKCLGQVFRRVICFVGGSFLGDCFPGVVVFWTPLSNLLRTLSGIFSSWLFGIFSARQTRLSQ